MNETQTRTVTELRKQVILLQRRAANLVQAHPEFVTFSRILHGIALRIDGVLAPESEKPDIPSEPPSPAPEKSPVEAKPAPKPEKPKGKSGKGGKR